MSDALSARIAGLAALMAGTGLVELSLTEDGETITLRGHASPGLPATPPAGPAADTVPVRAPCPGTVLLRHPLRPEPLVAAGAAVKAGDPLCLLRLGPLLVPVPAPVAGTVAAVEAEEGSLAGFGTPLFRLRPEG